MDGLAQIVVWLSAAADGLGRWLLAPVGALPGWLSATLMSVATGVLMLVVYKYTSHQRAIKGVRDDIKANLLALKLFKDSAAVAVRAQGGLLWGALRLLALSVVPMLVMIVPVCLLLAQMSLWFHSRPVQTGEDVIVSMRLNGDAEARWSDVRLRPTDALEVTAGPVRVQSQRRICWNVTPREAGNHRVVFEVDGQEIDKELAVGDGYMRVSTRRPGWTWLDVLEHPAETPFRPDSPVQSIEIDYPERSSWMFAGVEPWIAYWFAVSMVAGFCFSPVLKVNI